MTSVSSTKKIWLCQHKQIINSQGPSSKIFNTNRPAGSVGAPGRVVKRPMIAKACPKCEQQVPVACKACPCGYSFFNAKKAKVPVTLGEESRRRTQRVRREKPDYYDSLEYDKQVKRTRTRHSECDEDETKTKVKRKKIKKEEEEEDDMSVYANMSADKQEHCSIILAELNRKLQIVTWKPPF